MSDVVKLYDQATQLKAEGNLEGAADKLREALNLDPNYALGYAALAVVLQRLGQHDDAIAAAQKVCELEPNDAFSFTALSVTYQRAYAGTGQNGYIRLAEEAMERSRVMGHHH